MLKISFFAGILKVNHENSRIRIQDPYPGSGSESGSISQRHGSADPDPTQNGMDPQHCFQADLIWCDGTFKTLFWSMIKSIDYPSYLTISKRIHAIKNLLCLLILFDIPFCVLLFSERLLATSHWPEDINGERSFRGQIPSFAPVGSGVERLQGRRRLWFQAVFRIRIRIHRIHLFWASRIRIH